MQKTVETEVAIIGGGIAGLWLLNRLRQLGFATILLESGQLGGGQTHKSQGIIHGGIKYALQGTITKATESISDMPSIWRRCLQGNGEIDLSQVPILSQHQYLFSTNKLMGKLTGFLASVALQGNVALLAPEHYPAIFQNPQFKGLVYALEEMAIDVQALVRELVKPNQDVIFKIDPIQQEQLQFDEAGSLRSLEVQSGVAKTIQIHAKHYIFTAGAGNELVLKRLMNVDVAMQRRPLHMIVIKTDYSQPIFAHCLGAGATPRLTITTHQAYDGKTVWYLGGQLAEEGVKRDSAAQIKVAKQELETLFPWLDFTSAAFASFLVDRAEPLQPGGKRPDTTYMKAIKNMIVAWPTKLALAPKLAEEITNYLSSIDTKRSVFDTRALRAFPVPALAKPIWDELLC